MTEFRDKIKPSALRRTNDGYLVGSAPVARTGIQEYLGDEVGRPDMPVVRVYRPPEQVFARDAMHSYAFRPITLDHPDEPVTADNWKDVSVGQTGAEVVRDGELVNVPMVLMDAAAIQAFEQGQKEISMGYEADLVFEPGTTAGGQQYDAVQTNLRMNHLALVARARGGPQLKLGDDHNAEEKTMTDSSNTPTLRTVNVDGLSVQTTDAGAQAIERLQRDAEALEERIQKMTTDHQAALDAKDAELATKDTAIDELKKQVVDEAQLDAMVSQRAELVSNAKALHDADYSGKSAKEIRQTVLVGVLGKDAIEGKSEAYLEARFDTLIEDAKAKGVKPSFAARGPQRMTIDRGADQDPTGQLGYETNLQDGWNTGNTPATNA